MSNIQNLRKFIYIIMHYATVKHINQISEEKICVHEVELSLYTIYILLLHAP